jgi:hypothetical protein
MSTVSEIIDLSRVKDKISLARSLATDCMELLDKIRDSKHPRPQQSDLEYNMVMACDRLNALEAQVNETLRNVGKLWPEEK